MSEIKVGSIWRDKYANGSIRLEEVNVDHVSIRYIEHSDPRWIGITAIYSIATLYLYYKPVYAIEGFEV